MRSPTNGAPLSQVLSMIRLHESHGDYSLAPQQNFMYGAGGSQHSEASGAYQFQPATWRAYAKASGIGTQYAEAYQAPPSIQDAVAAFAATHPPDQAGVNSMGLWGKSAPPGGYPTISNVDVTPSAIMKAGGVSQAINGVARDLTTSGVPLPRPRPDTPTLASYSPDNGGGFGGSGTYDANHRIDPMLTGSRYDTGIAPPSPGLSAQPPSVPTPRQKPNTYQDLKIGDMGPQVADLQIRLHNAGVYQGPIDGLLGPRVVDAVKAVERGAITGGKPLLNQELSAIAGPEVSQALAPYGLPNKFNSYGNIPTPPPRPDPSSIVPDLTQTPPGPAPASPVTALPMDDAHPFSGSTESAQYGYGMRDPLSSRPPEPGSLGDQFGDPWGNLKNNWNDLSNRIFGPGQAQGGQPYYSDMQMSKTDFERARLGLPPQNPWNDTTPPGKDAPPIAPAVPNPWPSWATDPAFNQAGIGSPWSWGDFASGNDYPPGAGPITHPFNGVTDYVTTSARDLPSGIMASDQKSSPSALWGSNDLFGNAFDSSGSSNNSRSTDTGGFGNPMNSSVVTSAGGGNGGDASSGSSFGDHSTTFSDYNPGYSDYSNMGGIP